jgi:hypothetical protein
MTDLDALLADLEPVARANDMGVVELAWVHLHEREIAHTARSRAAQVGADAREVEAEAVQIAALHAELSEMTDDSDGFYRQSAQDYHANLAAKDMRRLREKFPPPPRSMVRHHRRADPDADRAHRPRLGAPAPCGPLTLERHPARSRTFTTATT